MVGGPSGGRETGDALDRDVAQSRKHRSQILTHWNFQPSTAFHYRKNRRNLRARLGAADVNPVLGLNRFAVWVVPADLRRLQILGRDSLLLIGFLLGLSSRMSSFAKG